MQGYSISNVTLEIAGDIQSCVHHSLTIQAQPQTKGLDVMQYCIYEAIVIIVICVLLIIQDCTSKFLAN